MHRAPPRDTLVRVARPSYLIGAEGGDGVSVQKIDPLFSYAIIEHQNGFLRMPPVCPPLSHAPKI
jgi:hypothetical protein